MDNIIHPKQGNEKMIEIYTRENCSLCVKAKELLTTHNIPYKEHMIDKDVPRNVVLKRFPSLTQEKRMLPIIVDKENIIKEKDELHSLLNNVLKR